MADFHALWGGCLPAQTGEDGEKDWERLIEQFADVALLGGKGTMTICSTYRKHFRTTSTFVKLQVGSPNKMLPGDAGPYFPVSFHRTMMY